MKVRSPDAHTWRVTRRWLPWRIRRRMVDGSDLASGADDPISFVVLLVIGLFVVPVVMLAVIFVMELLLLLLLLPFAVLARMVFGRHWKVEVRRGFKVHYEEEVGGWSATGERIRELAASIERGDLPPRTLGR